MYLLYPVFRELNKPRGDCGYGNPHWEGNVYGGARKVRTLVRIHEEPVIHLIFRVAKKDSAVTRTDFFRLGIGVAEPSTSPFFTPPSASAAGVAHVLR